MVCVCVCVCVCMCVHVLMSVTSTSSPSSKITEGKMHLLDVSVLLLGLFLNKWFSLLAQMVKKICLQSRRPGFDPWVGKIPWGKEWLPTPVFLPGIPWTEETGGL